MKTKNLIIASALALSLAGGVAIAQQTLSPTTQENIVQAAGGGDGHGDDGWFHWLGMGEECDGDKDRKGHGERKGDADHTDPASDDV